MTVLAAALTTARCGYNLATSGVAPRSAGLAMVHADGFDAGTGPGNHRLPVVLVPAAFKTAPPPIILPGRHLTMISSPQPVAAALRAFIRSTNH